MLTGVYRSSLLPLTQVGGKMEISVAPDFSCEIHCVSSFMWLYEAPVMNSMICVTHVGKALLPLSCLTLKMCFLTKGVSSGQSKALKLIYVKMFLSWIRNLICESVTGVKVRKQTWKKLNTGSENSPIGMLSYATLQKTRILCLIIGKKKNYILNTSHT